MDEIYRNNRLIKYKYKYKMVFLDKFINNIGGVALSRVYSVETSADYLVLLGYGNYVFSCPIGIINAPIGSPAPELFGYELMKFDAVKHHLSAIKSSFWVLNQNVNLIGGSATSTTVTGSTIEFQTNGASTEIGILDQLGIINYFAKVEIDSDSTKANLLPTAQELVTNGVMNANCLAVNGGTLEPTDRILNTNNPLHTFTVNNHYSRGVRRIKLVNNLTNQPHTVRITNTGYSPVGITATKFSLVGIYHQDFSKNVYNLNDSILNPSIEEINMPNGLSDNMFAFNFKPTTATAYEWIGHSGSQKITAVRLYLDGVQLNSVAVNDYTKVGNDIRLEVDGYCTHSQTGTVANYNQTINFNASTGITTYLDFTWLVSGIASGYCPQLSINNNINKANIEGFAPKYTLDLNNETYHHNDIGHTVVAWNDNSNWAVLVSVPYYKTNPNGQIQIQDRNGGTMNKIYFKNYDNSPIVANQRVKLEFIYRFKKFQKAIKQIFN